MKSFLPLVAASLLLCTFASAQDVSALKRTALAEQLIVELNVDKTMESALGQAAKLQTQILDEKMLSSEARDKQAKAMKETKTIFSWDAVKPAFVQIYAQTFTEDELQGMIDFFKTPVGQKWIEKQPQVQTAMMLKLEGLLMEAQPEIQEAVKKGEPGRSMRTDEEIHPPFVP